MSFWVVIFIFLLCVVFPLQLGSSSYPCILSHYSTDRVWFLPWNASVEWATHSKLMRSITGLRTHRFSTLIYGRLYLEVLQLESFQILGCSVFSSWVLQNCASEPFRISLSIYTLSLFHPCHLLASYMHFVVLLSLNHVFLLLVAF